MSGRLAAAWARVKRFLAPQDVAPLLRAAMAEIAAERAAFQAANERFHATVADRFGDTVENLLADHQRLRSGHDG